MSKEYIQDVLISTEEINSILDKLALNITNEYKDKNLVVVGILKGSAIFMCDLIKKIDCNLRIDFIEVSSYDNGVTSTGRVNVVKDLSDDISDCDVLVVEDIIDSGVTLNFLLNFLNAKQPKSLKLCTFLDKPSRRKIDVPIDFIGKEIEDNYVIGYGFDYQQYFRNLPYVGILKPEVYEK